jgi:hypothetical protein
MCPDGKEGEYTKRFLEEKNNKRQRRRSGSQDVTVQRGFKHSRNIFQEIR